MTRLKPNEDPFYLLITEISDKRKYKPFIYSNTAEKFKLEGTFPHLLDIRLVKLLPSINRYLHMPRNFTDFINPNPKVLKAHQRLHMGQKIIHMQDSLVDETLKNDSLRNKVALIIHEEATDPKKIKILNEAFPEAKIITFERLKHLDLKDVWIDIYSRFFDKGMDEYKPNIFYFQPTDKDFGLKLPSYFLANQLGLQHQINWKEFNAYDALEIQFNLDTLSHIIDKEPNFKLYEETFYERERITKFPVILTAPGVSESYLKAINIDPKQISSNHIEDVDDIEKMSPFEQELVCLRLIGAHEAMSHNGLSVELDQIQDNLFKKLDEIESYLLKNHNPKLRYLWKILDQLNDLLRPYFDDKLSSIVFRSSPLIIHSRFPIGMKTFPDGDTPIQLTIPTVYRPIMPLTRLYQQQFQTYKQAIYLGSRIKILFADMIDEHDEAGKLAKLGTNQIINDIKTFENFEIHSKSYDEFDSFNEDLDSQDFTIVIITAHGSYDKRTNTAGIVCGDKTILGESLKKTPPFIILRSCNTMTFGVSAVSIIDILLSNGAYAVIAAQIPIDAFKNSNLLIRFFKNMIEYQVVKNDFSSILDLWFHTTSTNPVMDIISSTDRLFREFNETQPDGSTLLKTFMTNANHIGIRSSHAYADSAKILLDITKGKPMHNRIKSIVENRNFFPETIFYNIFGWPDRIFLKNKLNENFFSKIPRLE